MPMLGGQDCGIRECSSRPWSWWSGIPARRPPHGSPYWIGCGTAYNRFVSYLADLKENAERRRSDDPEMGRCTAGKVRGVRPRADCQAARCSHQHRCSRPNRQPHRNIAAPSSRLCRSRPARRLPCWCMADTSPHVGRGRGRTAYAQFLELLRGTGHRLGLLTNGSQFRLIYAGLDFESSVRMGERPLVRWRRRHRRTRRPAATACRPEPIKDVTPGVSGLLDAVEESRKRQADLSSVLRENVRQAVELILEDVSTAHRTKPDLFASLVAAGSERQLTDAEAHEALLPGHGADRDAAGGVPVCRIQKAAAGQRSDLRSGVWGPGIVRIAG